MENQFNLSEHPRERRAASGVKARLGFNSILVLAQPPTPPIATSLRLRFQRGRPARPFSSPPPMSASTSEPPLEATDAARLT